MKKLYFPVLVSFAWVLPGTAQQVTRRANITGNAVDGKCTIEVNVDGAAEVEIQGDVGRMRNLLGQRLVWRRFVCNGRMPANPHDFRFRGIDGRGNVQLLQDPRLTGGRLVFRIDDPDGGREGYTVDMEWRVSNGGTWTNPDMRGWRGQDDRNGNGGREERDSVDRRVPDDGSRDRRYCDERGRWNSAGEAQAVRVCQEAASERIQRDDFGNVTFHNVASAPTMSR